MSDTQALERLERLATKAGAVEIAQEVAALIQRAHEGRFYIACVGQFKRGKSTLINTLLSTSVLPTGVVPITSVPTVLRYGHFGARVRQNGSWRAIDPRRLMEYVSQEGNPGNAKKVGGIEVFLSHPLLSDGLCLVDTPGLGSVFDANTASTRDFLPHIDAAIVVVGADPPISGEELRYVTELARQVDTLLFVLNKADRIPVTQRNEAVRFTRSVLGQALGRPVEPIYEVSAIAPDWEPATAPGWGALLATLERLPSVASRRLVQAAVLRGMERLRARLEALLEEERSALLQPLADSERRIQELTALSAGAARSRYELAPLLAAEEQRLADTFKRRRVTLLEQALPAAQAELLERLATPRIGSGRPRRRDALDLANDLARERLAPWLLESEQAAEAAYAEAVARFKSLSQDFVAGLAAVSSTDHVSVTLDGALTSGFQVQRGFYFTDLLYRHEAATPWRFLFDVLAPRSLARRRWQRAARRYLDDLLCINAERVENDLRDRVHESGRRLQAALDQLLAEVGTSAMRAVERGRAARAAGEEATREALERLEDQLVQLRTPPQPP
jgi:GTP-binding protein EngB required for normal cell division